MSRKPSTMFGTMDSGRNFSSLICPPNFVRGSLIFWLGESYRSKLKVSCLQGLPKSRCSTRFKPESITFSYYVNDMPNPSHHHTNKSQFADDADQWAVSKNIDLAAEYLQRDLDKLARWCAKWRIKLNPEKTSHNNLQVPNSNKGITCFISVRRPSFVLSSHKILRYQFSQ